MSTGPVKLIQVGMGGWGRDWARNAIPPVAEVERVACVDADASALGTAQDALGLDDSSCFTDLDAALGSVEADAVLITASLPAHIPLALQALRAGKHVLVEKPFAPSVAEATEAVELAAQLGRTLMVSQNYRFYPAARTAARLLGEKVLGPLSLVRIDFRKWDNSAEPGTHRHYEFVHPLLFDMAIHHFDLLRMVLGREPVDVYAKVADPPWSNYVDEASAMITITFEDGTVASYRGSWVSTGVPTSWTGNWHLECQQGEISWHGRTGSLGTAGDEVRVRLLGQEEAEPIELAPMPLWGRSAVLAAFARAVTTGEEPETSGRRNLPSLALMEAAAKSAASGRVEPVAR